MRMIRMTDLDLAGKRVMIREDLNVPLKDGRVSNDARIRAALPTIGQALEDGAAVILLSHLGRPVEGEFDKSLSLAPVAARLGELLGQDVKLVRDWLSGIEVQPGQVVLCENVRFNAGEKSDDESLGRKMAALCDVFVMDAFGTAHRAQASTHAVARFAPESVAGPLLVRELESLQKALDEPERPLVAIVGGAKVSTKLTLLETLSRKVDRLIVGGGIANTFIAAEGHRVGKSLYEQNLVENARTLMDSAARMGGGIPIPADVVVAKEFSADAKARVCSIDEVGDDEMIMDVGPRTRAHYDDLLAEAGTIVWNGPVGVFEFEAFSEGTRAIAKAVAESNAYSIAGGGDTVAAIEQMNVADQISYISTGGGAFLEFLEGRSLPAVAVLEERAREETRTKVS